MPSGCGEDADLAISPVSASQITTLQDWVDESMPATRATQATLRRRVPPVRVVYTFVRKSFESGLTLLRYAVP